MTLDPTRMKDWQIAEAAEEKMKPIRWLAEEFEKQHSVCMPLDMVNIDTLFSREAQINIYRIAQELLTNIGKHAQASHVHFFIGRDKGGVCLVIEDDGNGFDVEGVSKRGPEERGLGLAALNERTHMLQAHIDIQSQPGEGCRTTLLIPV